MLVVSSIAVANLHCVTAQETQLNFDQRIETNKREPGWNVFRGEERIAGYLKNSGGKPILYPLHGPQGHSMTRHFPMTGAGENEQSDHDHHRSLWFTHGEVNGFDFWVDDAPCGTIMQTSGQASIEDGAAVITTQNDWLDPKGNKLLADTRRFAIRDEGGRRFLDCDFLLKADYGDVTFGDTKEGTFGIRVAGTMRVNAKKGGQITNANGDRNKKAWGKKSPWTNYSGPIGKDTVGMTIHNHPSSFGFPCRWHVRTYGLFAANPFGQHHFTGEKQKTKGTLLTKGKTMRLSYRVVLSVGSFDPEIAQKNHEQFASDSRPELE